MSKTILIIVIVLALGIGGYFLSKRGYQAPTQSPTPAPGIVPGEIGEMSVSSEGESELKEVTVVGTEYNFSPSTITVQAGQSVKITFQNGGSINHNLVIEDLEVNSRAIRGSQTDIIEFIASTSGTYTIFCSVPGHRAAGMEGSLKIE